MHNPKDAHRGLVLQVYPGSNTLEFSRHAINEYQLRLDVQRVLELWPVNYIALFILAGPLFCILGCNLRRSFISYLGVQQATLFPCKGCIIKRPALFCTGSEAAVYTENCEKFTEVCKRICTNYIYSYCHHTRMHNNSLEFQLRMWLTDKILSVRMLSGFLILEYILNSHGQGLGARLSSAIAPNS